MRKFLMVLALSVMALAGAADKKMDMAKPEGTLVLGGLSPVEAVDSGAAMRGDSKIWSAYQGWQYNFPNAVHPSRSQLEPGDLVFFAGLGHEGIYIGNNEFIHAPHTGANVMIDSLTGWYSSEYDGATRILGP